MLDTATIRPQFPILETSVHGKPLIYLDNAATTQKPLAVLNAIRHYYDTEERQCAPRLPLPEPARDGSA